MADKALIFANGKLQTPSQLVAEQEQAGVVNTQELAAGTNLRVKTTNTTYEIKMVDPRNGQIIIHGGDRFPMEQRVRLNGATYGGSMLWVGRIGIGMRMEIERPEYKPLITSEVHEIQVIEAVD